MVNIEAFGWKEWLLLILGLANIIIAVYAITIGNVILAGVNLFAAIFAVYVLYGKFTGFQKVAQNG